MWAEKQNKNSRSVYSIDTQVCGVTTTMWSANISFHWILCAVCTTERSGGGQKKQQPGISVAEEPIIFCSGACFRCQTSIHPSIHNKQQSFHTSAYREKAMENNDIKIQLDNGALFKSTFVKGIRLPAIFSG